MNEYDIRSMTLEELQAVMEKIGEKPFKAKQIYQWLHEKCAADYEEMTNISRGLRERLAEAYPLSGPRAVEVQTSRIDGTQKYLFRLADGNVVESVLMRYHHGNSVCISSQVGCKMGCRFCASTLDGWTRNLLPSEMLSQIYQIRRMTGERVSNVVVMGTGEPLDNYDNLLRFIRCLQMRRDRISVREISQCPPADWCLRSGNWRKKIFRSRWRCPCMRRISRKESS